MDETLIFQNSLLDIQYNSREFSIGWDTTETSLCDIVLSGRKTQTRVYMEQSILTKV